MSERRRPLLAESWEREALELAAEGAACDDPLEQRAISTELWQREAAIREWNRRTDTRVLLPTVWQTIYGEDPGYIGLLSGIRDGNRLTRARSSYYHWPQDMRAAMQWAAVEDDAGRECYQCAH